jgi:DNA-binding NarL/FixJ family response regulator
MARRVLIVDDHRRFRETARRALQSEGWEIVGEAADGTSALRAFEALDVDLVLLDVGLPDISGLEVARTIRAHDRGVAVVMVSTHDSSDYQTLALACGASGFLTKAGLSGAELEAILGS